MFILITRLLQAKDDTTYISDLIYPTHGQKKKFELKGGVCTSENYLYRFKHKLKRCPMSWCCNFFVKHVVTKMTKSVGQVRLPCLTLWRYMQTITRQINPPFMCGYHKNVLSGKNVGVGEICHFFQSKCRDKIFYIIALWFYRVTFHTLITHQDVIRQSGVTESQRVHLCPGSVTDTQPSTHDTEQCTRPSYTDTLSACV